MNAPPAVAPLPGPGGAGRGDLAAIPGPGGADGGTGLRTGLRCPPAPWFGGVDPDRCARHRGVSPGTDASPRAGRYSRSRLWATPATAWRVDATGVEEARRNVHGTVPRAHACWRSELLVWTAPRYRARDLGGADFGPEWMRLAAEGET